MEVKGVIVHNQSTKITTYAIHERKIKGWASRTMGTKWIRTNRSAIKLDNGEAFTQSNIRKSYTSNSNVLKLSTGQTWERHSLTISSCTHTIATTHRWHVWNLYSVCPELLKRNGRDKCSRPLPSGGSERVVSNRI